MKGAFTMPKVLDCLKHLNMFKSQMFQKPELRYFEIWIFVMCMPRRFQWFWFLRDVCHFCLRNVWRPQQKCNAILKVLHSNICRCTRFKCMAPPKQWRQFRLPIDAVWVCPILLFNFGLFKALKSWVRIAICFFYTGYSKDNNAFLKLTSCDDQVLMPLVCISQLPVWK